MDHDRAEGPAWPDGVPRASVSPHGSSAAAPGAAASAARTADAPSSREQILPVSPQVTRIHRARREAPSRRRVRLARTLALAADALQIAVLPLVFEGIASPLEDILDVVTAALMIGLLGWHWAFLPAFASELVPFLDLFPTWSAAVFFVTRQGGPFDEVEG